LPGAVGDTVTCRFLNPKNESIAEQPLRQAVATRPVALTFRRGVVESGVCR
jgi:hypothetical protein